MADANDLRRKWRTRGADLHDLGARELVNALSKATPIETGKLEQARKRKDSGTGTLFVAEVEQPAGAGEPDRLPQWLDENTSFVIKPRRRGGVLRFRMRGVGVVFARSVRWRPRPESVGFWSKTMTDGGWRRSLQSARSRLG